VKLATPLKSSAESKLKCPFGDDAVNTPAAADGPDTIV
jgi:hypothetical protein